MKDLHGADLNLKQAQPHPSWRDHGARVALETTPTTAEGSRSAGAPGDGHSFVPAPDPQQAPYKRFSTVKAKAAADDVCSPVPTLEQQRAWKAVGAGPTGARPTRAGPARAQSTGAPPSRGWAEGFIY